MWSEYSLEVVDAVARNGSFTGAAQELNRVPSAISYQVRQLEEWLAVPLFHRRHRDVELTPAGRLFVDEARILIKKCYPPGVNASRWPMAGAGSCGLPLTVSSSRAESGSWWSISIALFPIQNC